MMTCNFDTENLSFPVFHPIYIYWKTGTLGLDVKIPKTNHRG